MTGAGRLALLASWCGLATALAELVLRAAQKLLIHRYIYLSRQIVWMTPLADLLLFGLCAAILALVAAAWPRAASMRVAASVLAFVAAMSVLAMQPWMAWWAMLCLAAGFAIQAGRVAEERAPAVVTLMRRTVPVFLAIVLALTVVVNGSSALTARRATAALPAPPAGAPNVLLIVWDAVRARDLSLYGYERPTTPQLTALGQRGVVFERAMSTGPYTLPGHAGLFTGRWPHQMQATWLAPLDPDVPTLAEVLGQHGWRTGAFSANHMFVTWEHGLLRGFVRAQDYVFSPGELARSSALLKWTLAFHAPRRLVGWYDVPGRRDAADVNSSFLEWLDQDRSRPFFAFLNVFDAHEPYLPPAPFDTLFGVQGRTGTTNRRALRALAIADAYALPDSEIGPLRMMYDGAIAGLDHNLDALLGELRRRGTLDNTLVIIAGDHGEEFGEHRTFGHGSDLYLPAVQVPLVMVYPRAIPGGERVRALASLRDVPATILELAGFSAGSQQLPGRSLSRFWHAGTNTAMAAETLLTEVDRLPRGGPDWLPVRRGSIRSILAWPYQLIASGPGLELYDMASDPGEEHDLSAAQERRGSRDSLVAALARWRGDAVPTKKP